MNDLLTAVQMYDFYLYDLQLYLDTHPDCKEALKLFKEYSEKSRKAKELYAEKYGPLTADQCVSADRFSWVSDPWPWERSAD